MELKINIDGLERSVSGVTDTTTCSQIIYALAHATSQRGRFVMVEKYRNVVSLFFSVADLFSLIRNNSLKTGLRESWKVRNC